MSLTTLSWRTGIITWSLGSYGILYHACPRPQQPLVVLVFQPPLQPQQVEYLI